MAGERWYPFETISLRDAMNSLFQESFVRPGGGAGGAGSISALPLDVAETENEFIVKASLPGVRPEDVQITVHGDTLTIRAESKDDPGSEGYHWLLRERRFGAFQRSLGLTAPINADRSDAHFDHGILTLTLPKAEEAKPKQIRIGHPGSSPGG